MRSRRQRELFREPLLTEGSEQASWLARSLPDTWRERAVRHIASFNPEKPYRRGESEAEEKRGKRLAGSL